MLLSLTGQPLAPAEIGTRLTRIDPNLGLLWLPDFGSANVQIGGEGHWAVTYQWAPTDRRHAFVQRGEWDPSKTFDIICFLPPDCPVDEAMGFVENGLRVCENGDATKLTEQAHRQREAHRHTLWQPAIDEAMQYVEEHIVPDHRPFSAGGL